MISLLFFVGGVLIVLACMFYAAGIVMLKEAKIYEENKQEKKAIVVEYIQDEDPEERDSYVDFRVKIEGVEGIYNCDARRAKLEDYPINSEVDVQYMLRNNKVVDVQLKSNPPLSKFVWGRRMKFFAVEMAILSAIFFLIALVMK